MREFIQGVVAVLLLFVGIGASFPWMDDRPNTTTWILRFVLPLIAILLAVILIRFNYTKDKVPDYLGAVNSPYFNRGGFCFAFAIQVVDNICWVHAHYQNQFERPCIGRIALRPARGFFLNRAPIDAITFEVPCEGAEFGVASLPIPLPPQLLGKKQSFEVGASVVYLKGKGKQLRFRDGLIVRSNTNFGNGFGTALTIVGAMTGTIVISSPAKVTLTLPLDADDEVPPDLVPTQRTIWKLGDPLLT